MTSAEIKQETIKIIYPCPSENVVEKIVKLCLLVRSEAIRETTKTVRNEALEEVAIKLSSTMKSLAETPDMVRSLKSGEKK